MTNQELDLSKAALQAAAARRSARGVSLLEVLVSVAIFSIAMVSLTSALRSSLVIGKLTEVHYAASSLASSRIEQLSAVDTQDLDADFDEDAVAVAWEGLTIPFTRSTSVAVNADDSRTVDVTVRSLHPALPTSVHFQTTFARWE